MSNALLKVYLQTKYNTQAQEISDTEIRMCINDMWIIIYDKKDIKPDAYCYAYLPSNQPELNEVLNRIKEDYERYESIALTLKEDLNKTADEMKQYLIEHIDEVKI